MRIVLCDDEPIFLQSSKKLLYEICEERGLDLEVFSFTSPVKCYDFAVHNDVDLFILDIIMDEMHGTDLAKSLRALKKDKFSLIFLSKSNDYAYESYSVDADYYILKPASKDKMIKGLERCDLFVKEKIVHLEEGKNTLKLNMQQIIAVEAFDKQCKIYTTNGDYEISTTLTKIKERLPKDIFWDIHRSYIININCVSKQQDHDFIMQNGLRVPIRQRKFSFIKRSYIEWHFQNIGFDDKNLKK